MALRGKPDVLISLLPKLWEDPKYQGQDKLPVVLWVIAQGDSVVGLYSRVHNFFPVISAKSCNTQLRDLILQLLERILFAPKARSILLNGVVRNGERLLPSLLLLLESRLLKGRGSISYLKRASSCWYSWKQSNEASYAADIHFCSQSSWRGSLLGNLVGLMQVLLLLPQQVQQQKIRECKM